jgi:calmodulin-regulated spectrin-associated protein
MESQWTLKKMPEHNNNISLEQYQQSIALMNNDLHDIQEDIQKLAEQQNQIQVQTMQAQQLLQAQQIANILNQQYSSQQNITGMYHPLQQQFGSTPQLSIQQQQKTPSLHHHQFINEQGQYVSTPMKVYSRENSRIIEDQYSSPPPSQYLNHEQQKHIAKYVQDTNHYRDQFEPQQPQFYLHGEQQPPLSQQQQQQQPQTPPQAPARRTWSQKPPPEMSSWSIQAQAQQQQQQQQTQPSKYDTWKISSPQQKQQVSGFVLHSQNNGRDSHNNEAQRLFPIHTATPPKPQTRNLQPNDDMMAPQSISFIADDDDVDEADNYHIQPVPRHNGTSSIKKSFDQIDEFETSLGKLNITSGSRTYRIPSPITRQVVAENSFQSMESQNENEKGFYISFDNDTAPKRPKPPLRTKRSPKKSMEELTSPVDHEPQEDIYQQKRVFNTNVSKTMTHEQPTSMIFETKIEQHHQQQQQPYLPRISSTPKEKAALVIDDVNDVRRNYL